MYNHYIRLTDNKIVKGFSTAFEQPTEEDVLIATNAGRHFELVDRINPPLTDEDNIPLYKYEKGKVVKRTQTEIEADREAIPEPAPSEMEKLKSRLSNLEDELVKKEIIAEAEKEALSDSR